MSDLLIRNLDEAAHQKLKALAKENKLSVSAMAAELLTKSLSSRSTNRDEMAERARQWRERLKGRFTNFDWEAFTEEYKRHPSDDLWK